MRLKVAWKISAKVSKSLGSMFMETETLPTENGRRMLPRHISLGILVLRIYRTIFKETY